MENYFATTGRSTKANAGMVLKTAVIFLATFGSYALILSGLVSPPVMLLLCVVMGVGMAGIGFAIAHDAVHGAYSSNPWVNRVLGWSFELCGANSYMWRITHNVIHHTYTNIPGIDEDLEVSPYIRLCPESKWHPYHRHQHWYAFPLYGFSTLNWVFMKDYKYFFRRELGPYKNHRPPLGEVLGLVGAKLAYYAYTIVIPLLVLHLPWWQFLLGYVVMHFTAGIILGVVFQLAHVVEGTEYPQPDTTGRMGQSWLFHEMATTANFDTGNRLLSWYVGGLNFQIEHHLFSKICSVHYPALQPIVRELAAKHGWPYIEHPTLARAIRSHYRSLKALGAADSRAMAGSAVA